MGVSQGLNHIKCPLEPLGSRNHWLFEALANGEVTQCTQRWCGLADSHVVLNSNLNVSKPIHILALCKAGATTRTKIKITYHWSYNHVFTCNSSIDHHTKSRKNVDAAFSYTSGSKFPEFDQAQPWIFHAPLQTVKSRAEVKPLF